MGWAGEHHISVLSHGSCRYFGHNTVRQCRHFLYAFFLKVINEALSNLWPVLTPVCNTGESAPIPRYVLVLNRCWVRTVSKLEETKLSILKDLFNFWPCFWWTLLSNEAIHRGNILELLTAENNLTKLEMVVRQLQELPRKQKVLNLWKTNFFVTFNWQWYLKVAAWLMSVDESWSLLLLLAENSELHWFLEY